MYLGPSIVGGFNLPPAAGDLFALNQNTALAPPEAACVTALQTVSAVCGQVNRFIAQYCIVTDDFFQGGQAVVAGTTFQFTLDPNLGECAPPTT
jgi:uncharacterized protein (DUF362 family)